MKNVLARFLIVAVFSIFAIPTCKSQNWNQLYKNVVHKINHTVTNTERRVTRQVNTSLNTINRKYNNVQRKVNDEVKAQRNDKNSYYNRAVKSFNDNAGRIRNAVNETTQEATSVLKNSIANTVNDGYKLSHYENISSSLTTNLLIAGFKNVPIYDVENNRLVSMDTYCRYLVSQMGGNESSGDLGKDPVATVVMMMMDDNYLYNAKIIQDPDGEWVSLNEASNNGDLPQNVIKNYKDAQSAYYNNNSQEFKQSFNQFISAVNQYNAESHKYYSNKKMEITSSKAYFHNSESYSSRRRAYCIRGDVVDVLKDDGDWVFVRFNGQKISSIGWMLKIDLENVK